MQDYLVRAIAGTASIRGLACVTTHLVNEACRRHGTYPTAAAALGRALTGGTLLGALLKTDQRVALKFEGDGPLRKLIVEAESNGLVRGYVGVPTVDLPLRQGKLDVAGALGRNGFLTVAKDLRLKEPYKGTVRLHTGEIAEDLAFYLTESEQVPSAVGLGVFVDSDGNVSASGGFLIQSLPPSNEEIIDQLIRQIEGMGFITELLRRGQTPEMLLDAIFSGIPFDVLERRSLAFQCSCSQESVQRALISLGPAEVASLIEKEERVDVTCEFCRQGYVFSREELEQLLQEMG